MITGKRYKIARRLGASVFEKTQGKKFALRSETGKAKPRRPGSDFGMKLIEKQRARATYGIGERQFKNIVERVINSKSANMTEALIARLETRLDNVMYRLGLASTRQAARQMVSHGHINVNGKRQTIPSSVVSIGDVITIRDSSKQKALFNNLEEKMKEHKVPSWLSFDMAKREAKVQGMPKMAANEVSFDVSQIFQYYSR